MEGESPDEPFFKSGSAGASPSILSLLLFENKQGVIQARREWGMLWIKL